MTKKGKSIFLVISLAILVGGGLILYSALRPKTADSATGDEQQILTVAAKSGSVSVRVEGPSVVEPYVSQDMRSKIEGNLITVPTEGDFFEKKAVLVRFDSTDQVKDLRRKKAFKTPITASNPRNLPCHRLCSHSRRLAET